MLETIYFAMGLHTRDRMNGVVLWDVNFTELGKEVQTQYFLDAQDILSGMSDREFVLAKAAYSQVSKVLYNYKKTNKHGTKLGTTIR